MGTSKRHQRSNRAMPPTRRTTRSSKGRLLTDTDPAQNAQQLADQLRPLGLYAADTTGDGNCLFRALSDQLYGSEARHGQLRQDVCDWIDRHRTRYAPFVDDDRGIDVHLRNMRIPATYGGHLELSAFAHMARRDVKVVQPGLVYVIEWASGWDPDALPSTPSTSTSTSTSTPEPDDRSRRAARRDKRKSSGLAPITPTTTTDIDKAGVVKEEDEEDEWRGPVYVAYHDWEHFSSIRNLRGPHSGIPRARELGPHEDRDDLPEAPTVAGRGKGRGKGKGRRAVQVEAVPATKTKAKAKTGAKAKAKADVEVKMEVEATQIPLPPSRSPSPSPLPHHLHPLRSHRSPKRTFDESSASSSQSSSAGAAKRSRTDAGEDVDVIGEGEDEDVLSDLSSLSSGPSSPSPATPPPPPPPPPPEPETAKVLTRRQRKALGLPKPRVVAASSAGKSAGKIVIPGGRYRKPAVKQSGEGEGEEEWVSNGTGRVDVRGFRELRI